MYGPVSVLILPVTVRTCVGADVAVLNIVQVILTDLPEYSVCG